MKYLMSLARDLCKFGPTSWFSRGSVWTRCGVSPKPRYHREFRVRVLCVDAAAPGKWVVVGGGGGWGSEFLGKSTSFSVSRACRSLFRCHLISASSGGLRWRPSYCTRQTPDVGGNRVTAPWGSTLRRHTIASCLPHSRNNVLNIHPDKGKRNFITWNSVTTGVVLLRRRAPEQRQAGIKIRCLWTAE